ncbi:unnamed protein product [Auanema sp. JU1783]|nr:unnamed protein product [Auanema sp. JU1783]
MSTYWLKNFIGLRQSEFELLKVPNPGAEFCIHVAFRSIQTGAVLGSIFGPLSAKLFSNKIETSKTLTKSFVDGGINGAIAGALLAVPLTYISLCNMNSVQLYDKCYRARFDRTQLMQDRTSFVFATLGYLSSGNVGFVVGLDLSMLLTNVLDKTWR